jgi:hypothetical protein
MWFRDSDARRALDRCRELEEQVLKLRRDLQALALDYETLYDKVKSALARMSKRAEVVEKAGHLEEGAEQLELAQSNGGPLTPRQKQIQQQVLRRRMGVSTQ